MKAIKELELVARDLVGDGKSPNVYFVTSQGKVVLATVYYDIAYDLWDKLSRASLRRPSALEDRKFGVVASVEPGGRNSRDGLVTFDDSSRFEILHRPLRASS